MQLLELREQNHFRLLVPRNVCWQRGGPIEHRLFLPLDPKLTVWNVTLPAPESKKPLKKKAVVKKKR